MILATHELYDLHELIMSCVNSITNMALYINQVQDEELRSILERHFPLHIQDYNMKVEYLHNFEGVNGELPVPDIYTILQSYVNAAPSSETVIPRTNVNGLTDREIATGYLLTLKRAGREYAWAAMEAANPQIRGFLERAFMMSSHHAYDVWQYMVKQGYYPIEAAPNTTISKIGQMYHVV